MSKMGDRTPEDLLADGYVEIAAGQWTKRGPDGRTIEDTILTPERARMMSAVAAGKRSKGEVDAGAELADALEQYYGDPTDTQARELLIRHLAALATGGPSGQRLAALERALSLVSLSVAAKPLETGSICPRCKQVVGGQVPRVTLNLDSALYALKLQHGAEYFELDYQPTSTEVGRAATVLLEHLTHRSGLHARLGEST